MKSIVFDTGPIISLVTNNILWILEPLKKKFGGEFYITKNVKYELIDRALNTKKFEFEAHQVYQYIKKGILKIIDNKEIDMTAEKLLNLSNTAFKARGNFMKLIQTAEAEALAADAVLDAKAVVIDERTARMIFESPLQLKKMLGKNLETNVEYYKKNIQDIKNILKDVQIIRSTELVTIAYKLGLFDDLIFKRSELVRNPKKRLLDSVLWAVKLRGCSVSSKEIQDVVHSEA